MFGEDNKKDSEPERPTLYTSKIYPEPTKGISEKPIKEKSESKKPKILLAVSIILLSTLVAAYVLNNLGSKNIDQATNDYAEQVAGITTGATNESGTGEYNSLRLPNTIDISISPFISGNYEVDTYIQQFAEKRGYVLRAVPRLPIVKTNSASSDDEDLLQPLAYEDWLGLKKEASQKGLDLVLNSGYRSVDWQRGYFLLNLKQKRVQLDAVTTGGQDDLLNEVMDVVAPPGYSRHHNGYTIDLACGSNNSFDFEGSACYTWISKDDFAVAKKYHFIPSYPEGADNQGPKPEPWEYVWVEL